MRWTQFVGLAGLAVLISAAPLSALAADAPAPGAPGEQTAAPDAAKQPAAADAGEGMPPVSDTAAEDADTMIEGEQPEQ